MSHARHDATPSIQRRLRVPGRWLVLLAVALLSACASAPRRSNVAPAPSHQTWPKSASAQEANNVLMHAIGLVGTPYHWGGNTPASGFDCSGLVDYVYRTSAQIRLPRTSRAMSRLRAPKIRHRDDLVTGDLLFFRTSGHRISHVAIYVGNGRFVHAPNSGGTVELSSLGNSYWSAHFAFGRRILD